MAKTWRKWLLTLTTALFVVLSALGWSLCLGDNFAKADTTLNTTSVTVTGATYGDGWLSITMSDVTYTNTGSAADFNGITNVGDHVWFSTDGETWTAKCNAGVGSENFVRTYYVGGTLNINVNGKFATDGYTYIKVQEGTIFPADGAFSEENSYYKTTEEVILKTDATSISNATTYAKYVAPTEVTVTGAKYGDGWLGIRFAGVSYTNDIKTIKTSNTNVGNHILFSADGNTWVEKSTLFATEYFARNYSLANCVNVGGLSETFSVTSYPYIKILEGTKFPADSAFDGTTSCNVTTEETILHYDNATGEYVKYVAPTTPVGVDTTVTGILETNYGYWGFNIGAHDYPTTGSNVSITSNRILFESNFTSKIKLTYTNGTTQYLSALAKEVLVYGGAMQDYLNGTGDKIAEDADGNAIVSDVTYDGTTIENVSQKITETGADTTTYRFRAVGLRVDNCNALYFRYYVKNGASAKIYINDVDYTANATVYATETEGKIYIVYVRNITPLNYADVYTAQLYGCADTTAEGATYELVETVKYSVNSFIRSKAEGEDAQLSALAKALYGYSVKANAYFKDGSLTNIVEWSAPSGSAQTNTAVYHAENANRVTLNANIGTDNYVKMGIHRVSGVTTDVALIGTIYYKSVNSDTIYSEAFYIERDATEFGMYLDVYRNGAIAAAIKNEEKEILYIDFRNVDSSASDGTLNISYIGHSSKDLFTDSDADHVIKMKSGDVTIGMDLDLGGSITYLSKDGINEYEIYRSKFGSLYYNAVRYIGTDPTQSPDYNTSYGTNGYRLVKSGNVNLINIHDTGREIQQSYYAGVSTADGSKTYYNASTGRTETYPNIIGSQDGAYMQYNPVQAGGVENYQSQIIDYSVERNAANAITSVYIKTRAMEWGSRTTYENKLSWSYMETWYSFKNGMIYVTNRFIDWKGFDSINANQNGAIGQETPAIYMASSLGTYYAQTTQYGEIKDSNLGAMTTGEYVSGGTNTSGNYHYAIRDDATMKWHAWLNKEDFGVGIYMPTSGEANVAYFAAKGTGSGNSGDGSNCYDNAYSYSSCCVVSDFAEQTALQYTYVLCVDNLTNMQTKLDGITDVDNSGLTAWTPRG